MICEVQNELYSEILDETADSVESIPGEKLFTVGTYQLDENTDAGNHPKRFGSLMLYEIYNENDSQHVRKLQTIKQNAILDCKWHSIDNLLLSVADSCGNALYFKLCDNHLLETSRLCLNKKALCLSTDWVKSKTPTQVAYSLSNGNLCVVDYAQSQPVILNDWKAHDLEAWIVACDYENSKLLYSGSDDCKLKLWDMRVGFEQPCFISKQHVMGVCSIQSSKHNPHIFCSGSYDESIVIWDNRSMKKPVSVVDTGGGVWRLKWHPQNAKSLLAACMHNGFKIIQFDESFVKSNIFSYDKHESLAYGVDWCRLSEDYLPCGDVIACCSFYDRLLSVVNLSYVQK